MKIKENQKSWSITGLSEAEMAVIVSMIRLEVGSGAWEHDDDRGVSAEKARIAGYLMEKINEVW